jgi:hypothetical protein
MTKCLEYAPDFHFDYPSRRGFLLCNECDGRGFLRSGDFAHREFPRCATCKGIGQAYLNEPAPPVKAD